MYAFGDRATSTRSPMPYADPERRRAYHRASNMTPARRAYRRQHRPMMDRVRHANQRARTFGVPGTITVADARAILAVGRCCYCGSTKRLTLDHRISMSQGGPNTVDNIVAACLSCNSSKRDADRPWRWSSAHEACVDCGGTDSRHASRGSCDRCYQRTRRAA